MKFYEQKYFQPYHKIAAELYPSQRPSSRQEYARREQQSSPDREYNHYQPAFDSPSRQQSSPNRAPTFQRSTWKHVRAERTTTEPIWQHLYNQGMKSQKELIEKHQNSKKKIDIECTFQPILRSNKRYLAGSSSNFLERVGVWQEHKIEKMVREKEQEVNRDLRECTFAPQINERRRRQEVQPVRQDKSTSQLRERNRNINPYYSPIKESKAAKPTRADVSPVKQTNIELSLAKQMIRSELKRIAL